MATIWTICGAGRGVGKTHLALALCEALPNATYAKLGHGEAKPHKPKNYFHEEADLAAFVESQQGSREHIVVECNQWALDGRGDIIVFIDRVPAGEDTRKDVQELRAKSSIRIGSGSSVREWRQVLPAKLGDAGLVQKVCGLLQEQKRFSCGIELSVRTKVWFTAGNRHVFGPGLANLLDNIAALGSLAEAARAAKISYRRAWDLVKDAQESLGTELIIPTSGGVGGGRSVLSTDGRRLLDVFKCLSRDVAAYADAGFEAAFYGENNEQT